jgi:outer membrane protein OmpA-like peptidoglycan-associated protein
MMLRAGRRLVQFGLLQFGLLAVLGVCGAALPAAAQSYLADATGNGSVTVDYSVLGQGVGIARPGMPMPSGAMPMGATGGCSCPGAPLGVIASAPRPTFNNPFGNAQVMQAPAVPPGFMPFSQAVASTVASAGGESGGESVVLTPPAEASQSAGTEMAPMQPEPSTEGTNNNLPATTPTANGTAGAATETPPAAAQNPATTPAQNATQGSTGGETTAQANPPPAPETMPTTVPSPVQTPAAAAPASPSPAAQAPATETPVAPAPQAPASATASGTATTPPAGEQQAAVTPPAPAGTATPAPENGTLPQGATRILYTTESDDVPATATADLDKIAQAMSANQDMRIQVLAYAAGTEDTESKARRKSLARALAVRSYLYKAGVPTTRIDVRALGTKAAGGPADRVDIIPAS